MSGPNLEGMPREARRNTIKRWLSNWPGAFTECYWSPQPEEAIHMLKRQDIMKMSADIPDLEGSSVHVKQIVEAMVWFNRDIKLFKGRPLSLLDRIMRRFDAGAEQVWLNISLIFDHVRHATLYVHIGGGTIVRVDGDNTKMYISEHSDFFDVKYNCPGFFLENYYLRDNGDSNRTFTLNILGGEINYHFSVRHIETAIAFMLTRHMGNRCAEVLQGVAMCRNVAEYVSGEARVGGSLVSTGVEEECSKIDLISRLLQTFAVKEDFTLKDEFESELFHRLSTLDDVKLASNLEWLSGSIIPAPVEGIEIPINNDSTDLNPVHLCSNQYVFADKKVFRRSYFRTVAFTLFLIGLISVATWATTAQDIEAPEKAEKWLTLALFGCIAAALSLVGSDRRRDLIRELVFFRYELFNDAGMNANELSRFICIIGYKLEKRRKCVNNKNGRWLGRDLAGGFEFQRMLTMTEIPGSRLLLRKNGDITFSWGTVSQKMRMGERFVRLGTDGVLDVGREAGPEAGITIACNVKLT